jgi:hypothetical protein
MADLRYCGDGHGNYAGTYIDMDDFKTPNPPMSEECARFLREQEPAPRLQVMDQPTFILRHKRYRAAMNVDRPRANVIDDEGSRWAYPKLRLFFVEYRGTQYAIIEQTADDAMSIVEAAERYQAWR